MTDKKSNIYLHLGSDIQGDITAEGYEDWIQIDDYRFGMQRSVSSTPGESTRRGGDGVDVSPVYMTKQVDKTTPLVLQSSCVGTGIPEVKIHYTQQGDTGKEPVQEILLKNCIVSKLQQRTVNGKPVDEIGISYTQIQITANTMNVDNTPGNPQVGGFNLETSKAL